MQCACSHSLTSPFMDSCQCFQSTSNVLASNSEQRTRAELAWSLNYIEDERECATSQTQGFRKELWREKAEGVGIVPQCPSGGC